MTVTLNIESAAQLIPVFLMKFRQEHPEAILDIRNRSLASSPFSRNGSDPFSSNEPIDSPHTVTLFKENLIVIMPKDSTLRKRKPPLSIGSGNCQIHCSAERNVA